jgi:dephospho-CoA kinase
MLTPDGELDRPRMGALVFADEAKRRTLEGIVHPLVFERYAELETAAPADAIVVHDIPLLVESGRAAEFDAVIVVDAPEELQLERMVRDRGWTEEDGRSRIAAQATREQRRAVATYLIENTGTREDLRRQVTDVFERLTRPA